MQDIKSLTLEELKQEMGRLGEPSFRAKQMYQWMHQKLARGVWRNDQPVCAP